MKSLLTPRAAPELPGRAGGGASLSWLPLPTGEFSEPSPTPAFFPDPKSQLGVWYAQRLPVGYALGHRGTVQPVSQGGC